MLIFSDVMHFIMDLLRSQFSTLFPVCRRSPFDIQIVDGNFSVSFVICSVSFMQRRDKSSQAKRSKYIYISISLPLGDSKGALYEMKNILNWFPPVKTHPIKFVLNFVIQGFSIIVPHVTRFQETHYYNSAAELLKD